MHAQVEDTTPHTFILTAREERQEIIGRDEAVKTAKDWSDNGPRVVVEREDERVMMTFEDGGLVQFVYETRDRLRKKKAAQQES